MRLSLALLQFKHRHLKIVLKEISGIYLTLQSRVTKVEMFPRPMGQNEESNTNFEKWFQC